VGVVLCLILTALWVVFPFMVYAKFNELIRVMKSRYHWLGWGYFDFTLDSRSNGES